MKHFLVIACLLIPVVSTTGEELPRPHEAPRAWLGLEVSKPDETITAQMPSLPPGIGFVIRMIDKDGPAAAAGLREFDIIWKIGDQMLVNEGQLAALLRLNKPGDEIRLSGFRSGQPLEVILKLGEVPASKRVFPGDLVDAAILPGECGGPMRVVNVSEKLASYSNSEGRVEVRRDGQLLLVKIQDPADGLIYEGRIPVDGSLEEIPQDWRRRVHALRRGLDHALDGRIMPARQPRPRVVPPPERNP
ncbi:MAG: PDZ domain-containing protein [Verrucomicrobiaceae bacterium]|nr:MAG: PDZ domain-containing protein [Verrucomicrobiaceae bacterium]RPJ35850.1 MAG: PDZ domain-containing protein [Verrucomicrobiaceae bacterium]